METTLEPIPIAYADGINLPVFWSGWRLAQDSNIITGWFMVRLGFFATDGGVSSGRGYFHRFDHIISMVSSPAYARGCKEHGVQYEPMVAGSVRGATFNILNSPCLEDCPDEILLLKGEALQDALDKHFAEDKQRAFVDLVNHLSRIDRCQ
jgi:hypothetical protein